MKITFGIMFLQILKGIYISVVAKDHTQYIEFNTVRVRRFEFPQFLDCSYLCSTIFRSLYIYLNIGIPDWIHKFNNHFEYLFDFDTALFMIHNVNQRINKSHTPDNYLASKSQRCFGYQRMWIDSAQDHIWRINKRQTKHN